MSTTPASAKETGPAGYDLSELLLKTLTRFINLPLDQVESEITLALKDIGSFVGADRVYIFSYDVINQTTSNTHEWCAKQVEPQIQALQKLPLGLFPEWWEAHRQGRAMYIEDVARMDPGVGLQQTLQAQGIKSLLALPLMNNGKCLGFVGFDWVKTNHTCAPQEYEILEIFARMLTNISLRQQADWDRTRLQDKISQMARMESMGRLASGIAHDFNNLLMVIQSHCRLAEFKLPAESPVLPHLQGILEAAERSADLTARLLAFARKQEIKPVVIDLNSRIAHTIHMLRHAIGSFIKIQWTPGEHVWNVKMDPGQLEQVITNLCMNAKDAIEEAGSIAIETSNIQRAVPEGDEHAGTVGDYVKIVVRDSGSGMDKNTLEHIFEPFFTTKPEGKGTGLGLSIVYSIVQQNNGHIEVESVLGQGTAFTLYFRRCDKQGG